MMKKLLFSLLIGLSCQLSFAQQGWEAGGWAGISYYFGDLNTNFDLGQPNLSGGLIARYNFNNRIAAKFSANYGFVEAYDSRSENIYEQARNLSFQSNILDGTFQMEFNFFPYNHGSKDEFFTPYLLAGFSVFYFNPKTEYEGELVELRPLGTEGQFKGEEYYTVTGALSYGGGIKIDLSYRWSLNLEINARRTFTDYLDDVSTVYPDKDDLEQLRGELAVALTDRSIPIPGVNAEEIGEPGRQRGNSRDKDTYVMVGLGVLYYFGDLRCPTYGRR